MHETPADLEALQAVLDVSRTTASDHLREILSEALRLSADELVGLLIGVRVLVVATVTATGEPLSAPADGILHRGRFHFATSPDSVRARHLAARPAVSATYLEGEQIVVMVHGRAVRVDPADPAERAFRETLAEVYEPRYGPTWIDWATESATYYRIEPRRMFASRLPGS
jgi:nitroimidazol reductase NimA-like FMN-containing flavoprotein (pyridoxamine 5'-phosphate oxidase superfamily)